MTIKPLVACIYLSATNYLQFLDCNIFLKINLETFCYNKYTL